jgi:hypothetical protein
MPEPVPNPANPPRQLADVPVFNCHVYLSPPDERGTIHARAASLADLQAEGRNEREALRNIVARFKETLAGYLARQEPIPWLAAPHQLAPGEMQRFVPVHF